MPFRTPSGIVVGICPDPAYHWHWYQLLQHEIEGKRFEDALDDLLRYIVENDDHDPAELKSLARLVQDLRTGDPTSRMAQLMQMALDHPLNAEKRLPHIIRVAGPGSVAGDPVRMMTCIGENFNVVKGAHTVLWDAHSDCFDVAERHSHMYSGDQAALQMGWLLGGGQQFTNFLAAAARRKVTFRGMYTRFGPAAEVERVEDVCTFEALAPAA